MKNRLFYFAACVALVLSSVSCSSDDGEEEDADIPVVGKIAVSGAYNVYSHGSQGQDRNICVVRWQTAG